VLASVPRSLGLYLFYDSLYTDEQKHYPKVDFVVSVVLAMFWLAGSSAWANGLTQLKNICSGFGGVAIPCQALPEQVTLLPFFLILLQRAGP
jgi:hypothetical protein